MSLLILSPSVYQHKKECGGVLIMRRIRLNDLLA